MLQAVIYDLDGLLLDTEPIHAQVYDEVAQQFGVQLDPVLQAKLRGRPSRETSRLIVETLNLPVSPAEFLAIRKPIIEARVAQSPARPGAPELVRSLHQRAFPQAIATSSTQPAFAIKTQQHQPWVQLIDLVVCGDDPQLERPKPAPDIFWLAAQRLGVKPEDCLVFEDSISGVRAALEAGMTVVAVPDPVDRDRLPTGVHHCLDSLAELQDRDRYQTIFGKLLLSI
ncbi:HAD family hydrolase [Synechococcus elongatus]|uniref:HAD-IA family hydrolase n=1 Tax=Synechococcus elongatus PCC 11802 TaxID=2283154 RepID=A0AAT9K5T3_SYNEL|nr:HAD-IA family hydrolase [Synechococcus elongatus]QFZ93390.1 HAD family hydrolase [Synechococcus elongatus PCC 11802]